MHAPWLNATALHGYHSPQIANILRVPGPDQRDQCGFDRPGRFIVGADSSGLGFAGIDILTCMCETSAASSDVEQTPAGSSGQRADATAAASTSYEHLLERHKGGQRVWGPIVGFGHLTPTAKDAGTDGADVPLRQSSEYFVDVLMNTLDGGVPTIGNIMGYALLHTPHAVLGRF